VILVSGLDSLASVTGLNIVVDKNSTLAQCLCAHCSKNHEIWKSLLPGIMMAFRMSPAIESTEYSPFFLLFGKEMNLPFDIGIQPKENMGSYLLHNSAVCMCD
jgi:hypothetical protein